MTPLLSDESWLHALELWDRGLFFAINKGCANGLFDATMPYLRNSSFWAPLYVFLFFFAILNGGKRGWWWCLLFLCTVALTDMIGTRIFKNGFERLRPCADPAVAPYARLVLQHCSGAFSFISNHAANHFGMATFWIITFRPLWGRWVSAAYFWSLLIGFAQIYVGVHYPLDVAGGALLGTLAGLLTGRLFMSKWGSFT